MKNQYTKFLGAYFLFLFILFVTSCGSSPERTGYSQDSAEELISELVSSLEQIVTESETEDIVYTTILSSLSEYNESNLNITYSDDVYGGIIDSTEFTASGNSNESAEIIIRPFLLDVYQQYPGLAMSYLVREMTSSSLYFTEPDIFQFSQENILEEFKYEMDCIYTQTLFLRDYILPSDYQISNFGEYLIQSLEDDELHIYAVDYLGVNKLFVYSIDNQTRLVLQEQFPEPAYRQAVQGVGADIITEWENSQTDDDKFYYYTALDAYVRFVPVTLGYVMAQDGGSVTLDDILAEYPGFAENYHEMIPIVEEHEEFFRENLESNREETEAQIVSEDQEGTDS
ncbi:MAG: hypothetical protein ACLFR1_10055 [Spirochaetia bacterium]